MTTEPNKQMATSSEVEGYVCVNVHRGLFWSEVLETLSVAGRQAAVGTGSPADGDPALTRRRYNRALGKEWIATSGAWWTDGRLNKRGK